jgi:hypothetical protein
VLFFGPIIDEIEARGHETFVTARASGHIIELLQQHQAPFVPVGSIDGLGASQRYLALVSRILALRQVIKGKQFDLAVNHGSRSQIGAAALSRVACITSYDYEFSSKLFVHPLVRRAYIPRILIASNPRTYATSNKFVGYPGLKEHVYLSNFSPNPTILTSLNLDPRHLLVVIRPPATEAHYYNPLSSELMSAVLRRLAPLTWGQCQCVILPRDTKHTERYHMELNGKGPFLVPPNPIDSLSLMSFADVVISGGGTMVREAAVLGIPAFSIFAGATGAIDRYLADRGFLTILHSAAEIDSMPLEKRTRKRRGLECDVNLSSWFADRLITEAEPMTSC